MQGQTSQRQAKKESKRHDNAVYGNMLQLARTEGLMYVKEEVGYRDIAVYKNKILYNRLFQQKN